MIKFSSTDMEFTAWCILRSRLKEDGPYTESQFTRQLSNLDIAYREPKAPLPKGDRGKARPLQVGEVVIVRADKCGHELNTKNCRKLNFTYEYPRYFKVDTITEPKNENEFPTIIIKELDDTGRAGSHSYTFYAVPNPRVKTIVKEIQKQEKWRDSEHKKFDEKKLEDAREKLRLKSLEPHDQLGLYRAGYGDVRYFQKYLQELSSKTQYEVIYKFGTEFETPHFRSRFTEEYGVEVDQVTTLRDLESQITGDLSVADLLPTEELKKYVGTYFKAPINYFSQSSKSQYYAQLDTKYQRGTFTTINPSVGQCYYIGKIGERPSGWREDLKEMLLENIKG